MTQYLGVNSGAGCHLDVIPRTVIHAFTVN